MFVVLDEVIVRACWYGRTVLDIENQLASINTISINDVNFEFILLWLHCDMEKKSVKREKETRKKKKSVYDDLWTD